MTPYRHQEPTLLCARCREPAYRRCPGCRAPMCPAHEPEGPGADAVCAACDRRVEALVRTHLREHDDADITLFGVSAAIFFVLPVSALFLPMGIALSLLCGLVAVMAPVLAPITRSYREHRVERVTRKVRARLIDGRV